MSAFGGGRCGSGGGREGIGFWGGWVVGGGWGYAGGAGGEAGVAVAADEFALFFYSATVIEGFGGGDAERLRGLGFGVG